MVVGCGVDDPDAHHSTTKFDHTPALRLSLKVAEKEWDHPCDDDVTVWLADLPDPRAGEAYLNGCNIWLDRDYYNGASFLKLCSLVDHEMGHVAGYEHSSNPDDVMYPYLLPGIYADACLSAEPLP